MEILKGIRIIDRALWLQRQKVLVLADLHMGYEESLNKQGVLVPRMQFNETIKGLKKILNKVKPKTIIINGDLKHEFGTISRQEWRDTLDILDILMNKCKRVILLRGNHDATLGPVAKVKNLEIKDFECLDSGRICVLHGQKILLDSEIHRAKTIIIAHEHPAVRLHEGAKSELYKCFLLGKWQNKKVVVMPSFLPNVEGLDIKRGISYKGHILLPYLQKNLKNFNVFVLGDKVYKFGRLKNL